LRKEAEKRCIAPTIDRFSNVSPFLCTRRNKPPPDGPQKTPFPQQKQNSTFDFFTAQTFQNFITTQVLPT
jgi:hypothetical protein